VRTISIGDAKNRLTELALLVEAGETIVVTRNGRPVLDLVPHKRISGLNVEAMADYKKRHGIPRDVTSMPADFDRPLDEDILLKPLPPAE
jgi:prevent-host-death family protein